MKSTRRGFLGAALGAAAVAGFDPVARTWVSVAHARRDPFESLPAIEGEVTVQPEVLEAFATDTGAALYELPVAVLRPASAGDIAAMIRFCRRHRIVVAARGQGHTTDGQALAGGGLVIDMSTLNAIHSVNATEAEVDAGVTWKELFAVSLPQGLTPPVLTGYINLSVGGTLSVGGISRGFDRGSQGDHVLELEVVTGEGQIVRCSEWRHRDLFHGALAGLGQVGIITRVVTELVPALPRARTYVLPYVDNAVFFEDLRLLLERNEVDDAFVAWVPDGAGGWIYLIQAAKFYDPSAPPDDDHLRRDLRYIAPTSDIVDTSYEDYTLQVDYAVDGLKAAGLWDGALHPWLDVWLPGSEVEEYVDEVLPTLTPEDVGENGFMLMFPHRRSRFTRPFFRLPDDEWVYLFDVLTLHPPGPDPEFQARMVERNRRLYEKARDVGGTRYPIGTLPFSRRDWRCQYGWLYRPFRRLQRRYDPSRILTPGLGL